MSKNTIDAKDLHDLIRGVEVAFTIKCEKPGVFGAYTDDIDKAADALVSIRATLTDEKMIKAIFGDLA